jgi:hypothetical protein
MSMAVTPAGNDRPGDGLGDGLGDALGVGTGVWDGEVAGPTDGPGCERSTTAAMTTIRAAATGPATMDRRRILPEREADSCPIPGTEARTASITGSVECG